VTRSRIAALLAAGCLALAGCGDDDDGGSGGGSGGGGSGGGGSGGGEEAAVQQGLTDYATAFGEGDAAAACDHMTEDAQNDAEDVIPGATDCESAHEFVLNAVGDKRSDLKDQLAGVDFEVEINGETATMTSPKAPDKKIRMEKVGGEWKLDQNTLTYTPKK
jgi:hypothetical protein